MAQLTVINSKGEKVEEIEVPDFMFQLAGSETTIHDVVRQQYAARRRGTASTLTRGEVSASGRKPWRQKGTGRARAGDRGSPIWRGGGIIFGPRPRDYSFSLPKKVKIRALKSALAIRFQKGQVLVVDELKLPEAKTKHLVGILNAIGAQGGALILTLEHDKDLHRTARNLPGVEVIPIVDLNTLSVLSHQKLVVTRDGLLALKKWMEKIR